MAVDSEDGRKTDQLIDEQGNTSGILYSNKCWQKSTCGPGGESSKRNRLDGKIEYNYQGG